MHIFQYKNPEGCSKDIQLALRGYSGLVVCKRECGMSNVLINSLWCHFNTIIKNILFKCKESWLLQGLEEMQIRQELISYGKKYKVNTFFFSKPGYFRLSCFDSSNLFEFSIECGDFIFHINKRCRHSELGQLIRCQSIIKSNDYKSFRHMI